jgi:hypothetical protein
MVVFMCEIRAILKTRLHVSNDLVEDMAHLDYLLGMSLGKIKRGKRRKCLAPKQYSPGANGKCRSCLFVYDNLKGNCDHDVSKSSHVKVVNYAEVRGGGGTGWGRRLQDESLTL